MPAATSDARPSAPGSTTSTSRPEPAASRAQASPIRPPPAITRSAPFASLSFSPAMLRLASKWLPGGGIVHPCAGTTRIRFGRSAAPAALSAGRFRLPLTT